MRYYIHSYSINYFDTQCIFPQLTQFIRIKNCINLPSFSVFKIISTYPVYPYEEEHRLQYRRRCQTDAWHDRWLTSAGEKSTVDC